MNAAHTNKGQSAKILRHLQRGLFISPLEALKQFDCMRLGARIHELRRMGHPIERKIVRVGRKRFAEYHLPRQARRIAA